MTPSADIQFRSRLPVTIVTGFLGSGKTTLLNHIMAGRQGRRIAIMVNEVGEIGIDADLIVSADNDMLELSDGCICCSLNSDFIDTIFRVLERGHQLDHLLVETTGLADPVPIILTFLRSEFRDRVRLDAIIAIADADNFSLDLLDSKAAYNQLRYADAILLNKCDLAGLDQLNSLESKIHQIQADTRIIRTVRCAVPLALILDGGRSQDELTFDCHLGHDHLPMDGFVPVAFESDRPFALDKFQHFLDNQLPDAVFRGKGILWMDWSDKRYIFHLVGKRFSLDEDQWNGPRKSRLVLIGRNLDKDRLRQQLAACIAQEPA
jgi:G3E family GTPase